MEKSQFYIKRIGDLLLAIILLIVLIPILLVLSVLVYCNLGSPILFTQIRPGKNGVPFTIYKFRTMIDGGEGDGINISDGERITPFGGFLRRTSLDELPELINVIKGEMSLVGPRPLLMEYLEKYSDEQARRHDIKPGITGWAQINGRNAISWEEKLKLDVWYIDHWNLALDVKILIHTVIKVIKQEGIRQDGKATMEKFDGLKNSWQYHGGRAMKKNVIEYFESTLLKHKEKLAIIDQKGQLTFGELEKYSKRLSEIITKRGNTSSKSIPVLLPKSNESLIAFLGILYSGNAYVPIDSNSPSSRIKSIIEDLGSSFIICSDKQGELAKSLGLDDKNMIYIEEVYNEFIIYNNEEIMNRLKPLIDLDPVYIIYTSGSTGKPKGVVICHRSVIDYIDWAIDCFHIGHGEIIGNQSPFYFDNSTLDIYLCLAAAATLVIIPEQHFAFPIKLLEYVVSRNINFIFWVPSVMVNIANTKALDDINASCLKKVLFAGEIMPNKHLNYWRSKLPNSLFANLYGPTEITVDCTYYIVNRDFEDYDPLPIGMPCRNTDILILNKESNLAEQGELGELCVRGSSLALGYWKDFNKSNHVFIQNPLNSYYFDRIYRTGDLVYLNERDEIIFVGRKDSQIKHLGYRIELGEIEKAVLSLQGVHNACVLYNKEKKEITLFYEANQETKDNTLRKELLVLLPKYMVPTKLYKCEKLPLNSNGKIDRRKLASEWIDH